jgi:hypothetical protein
MSKWTREELQEALREVARRSAVDREFRALALRDAVAAIRQVNPKPLLADVSIQFVDNSGPTKVVPLPDLQPGITEENIEFDGVTLGSIRIGFFPTVSSEGGQPAEPGEKQ